MATTAQLSENSHQGFDGIKAALCQGSMKAKSNTASGMPLRLRQNGIGSRGTGKERDAETGLDYFLARYYSGAQGRFLSVDPENAGAKHADPQSWNAYSYALNNPLRYVDPLGLAPGDCYVDGVNVLCSAANTLLRNGAAWDVSGYSFEWVGTQQQDKNPIIKVSIEKYSLCEVAECRSGNGVEIELLATVKGSNYQHFNWIQWITTSNPLSGNPANKPYLDRRPGQKTPFYWTEKEMLDYEKWAEPWGASTMFIDSPHRAWSGIPITWYGYLSLIGIYRDGSFDRLRSYSYGFTIDAKGVHVLPLREIR
jgi:RHS repeat-associated protein